MSLYSSILRPILFRLPAETAHELALRSLSLGLSPNAARRLIERRLHRAPFGELRRFGLAFANPVGLAAGFDKDGTAAQSLAALGFGFIEVGTATREPQPGNPRPRVFRLTADRALVNRAGFNNCGAQALAENIKRHRPGCVLGVNIGKGRHVPITQAIPDYLGSFQEIYEVADYIAINVSSPNTPHLRDLQRAGLLAELLSALQDRNQELARECSLSRTKPLLLKIAPDLGEREIESIVEVALGARINGIIATNTTTSRDGLASPLRAVEACGEGGLSGAPLRRQATEIVRLLYRLARGALEIVGVGGIFTAEDAWEKICAGASLVQLYTGFVYEGPGVARRINEELAAILRREGLNSLDEAVGCKAAALRTNG